MKAVIDELSGIVKQFEAKFQAISDADFASKPRPEKWSRKEVLGHLIDSAQNNLRRFIVGQYETVPAQIVYNQDLWVLYNHYQAMPKEDLITLWRLLNERIAAVLRNMPPANYKKQSMTSELHTLEFLAEDYVKHIKHHLNQIIAGSFDIVYK